MRRKSKGISPLVAVIMLIAFTMIVAGILAGWATRFATEQRQSLEKCTRANLVIKRAVWNDGNITLLLYNAGTVPLEDFNLMISFKNETAESPDTWTIDMILEKNSFQTTVPYNTTYEDIDYIEVKAVECPGAYDLIRSYDIAGF